MSSAARRRLLILGGTGEARELAALVDAELGARVEVTTSLAGRTESPAALEGAVRRGGFGGVTGLRTYLQEQRIDYVIDATHPFAVQISAHLAEAAQATKIPRLMLLRPPWSAGAGDRWIAVTDARAAAAIVPTLGRRVWLTVGAGDIAAFASLDATWFLVRRVDPPPASLPLREHVLILARGPFAVADERRLMSEHRIDVLVCRASGGAATEAKLIAAREAGLPVVMIRRPPKPPGEAVETPAAAVAWLTQRLDA
jgi:precorrin-6A/cobalt-precorrin-6A reductase